MGLGTHNAARRHQQTKGPRFVRGRLWYAMRTLRHFRLSELQAVAEVPNRATVQTFIAYLRRAGFVAPRHLNRGLHQETIFTLVRNSGPKCPAILKRRTVVWDYNTDTEYPIV